MEAVNARRPDYIGFVFAPGSRRYVTPEQAAGLKKQLAPGIAAVGVFVDEDIRIIAGMLQRGTTDMAQLHGHETDSFIRELAAMTGRPLIQAFRIRSAEDVKRAEESRADMILLDAGAGTGTSFDWSLIRSVRRPYFLAGGLHPGNVETAIETLHPFAVDVSSGVETDGYKDENKIERFVAAVRRIGPEDRRP